MRERERERERERVAEAYGERRETYSSDIGRMYVKVLNKTLVWHEGL